MREAGGSCLASRKGGGAWRIWEQGAPGLKLASPCGSGDGQAEVRVDIPQALSYPEDGEKRTEVCGSLLWGCSRTMRGRGAKQARGARDSPWIHLSPHSA